MIADNYQIIQAHIPNTVKLIAVSKTYPNEAINQLYKLGHRDFGENKVQELVEKYEHLPKDIRWHLIGHLQRNKVKYIAPFVTLIHSVDSLKLLQEINAQAIKHNRTINCLLQFHIANEDTKYGLTIEEADEILQSVEFKSFKNIFIVGVMGMATFTEDERIVRREFTTLKNIFEQLKSSYFYQNDSFREISMGMSGDYKLAIQEGSTMVRVGSLIFGNRPK